MAGELVDVVIPCRDEAAALPWVLARIPTGCRPLVVDNGSIDGSADVAASLGARVVHEPRPGYGAAVHTGVLAARTRVVAVVDGDGSIDLAQLPRLIRPVALREADLAVGRRRPTSRRAWRWHARLGNAALAGHIRRRWGVPIHDLAPVRVAQRDALLALGIADRRSGYPVELLLRAAAAGWSVVEQDVTYLPRAADTRSKVTGSLSGTIAATRDMAAVLR